MCRLFVLKYEGLGTQSLYRYDVDEPPEDWSNSYKSKEYIYDTPNGKLIKNQIGAHFFFDDMGQAYNTGRVAAKKLGVKSFWMTKTTIIKTINLLDISLLKNITSILIAFDELGLDVLTNNFKKINLDGSCGGCFQEVRDKLESLKALSKKQNETLQDVSIELNLANTIGQFFLGNDRVDYFGQLLTDFENGIAFKELLTSRCYDGYVFSEAINHPTLCIFDSSALSKPIHCNVNL